MQDAQSGVKYGAFYVIAAATLWGTTGTTQALAPLGSSPLVIGTMRILVGGITLIFIALYKGSLRQAGPWPLLPTVLSILSTALYQVAFFGGTHLTGVAVGTVVGIGASPIFAGLLGAVFLRERVTGRWWLATALAIVGCALLLAGGEVVTIDPLGILLALGAGLSYAVFTLASKHLLAYHSPDAVMAVTFGFAALCLVPLLPTAETSWIGTLSGLVVVLYLGVIVTGLSYTLFGRGLKQVMASTAATLTLAEPLTAALLGILLLQEAVPPIGILGIGLIFLGLAVLTVKKTGRAGRR